MILAAGLSPAWQQILTFDALHPGEVNRAQDAVWCASGKVINVATALSTLGSNVTVISAIGGISGEIIQRELDYLNVRADWIPSSVNTRVCTTLLTAGGQTTELVENMPELEEDVITDFINLTATYTNVADLTVFSGSLPPNAPPNLFAGIMQHVHKRFLLDLRGEALDHCLQLYPFLIKPNREELQATLRRSLERDDDLIQAMKALNDWGVRWVVVSDGAKGLWVSSEGVLLRMIPPRIQLVNPIGCGDSLAAGIACRLEKDDDVVSAIRFGMGAAANNAEQLLPARLDRERAAVLAEQVVIEQVEPASNGS